MTEFMNGPYKCTTGYVVHAWFVASSRFLFAFVLLVVRFLAVLSDNTNACCHIRVS